MSGQRVNMRYHMQCERYSKAQIKVIHATIKFWLPADERKHFSCDIDFACYMKYLINYDYIYCYQSLAIKNK